MVCLTNKDILLINRSQSHVKVLICWT